MQCGVCSRLTSSGVRLNLSSALMFEPLSRSHSATLHEPSLDARCLRAGSTWSDVLPYSKGAGASSISIEAGLHLDQCASMQGSQWRPPVVVAACRVRYLHRRARGCTSQRRDLHMPAVTHCFLTLMLLAHACGIP